MGLRRRDIIFVLLVVSSISIGIFMTIATAPIHEFGHYIAGKSFGWNITEVDWYSYVEFSEETLDNAPRWQKIIVSIAGMILAPIIPYILLTRRRSMIMDIVALPYLGYGILGSCGDLKNIIWRLLTNALMPRTEYEMFTPMNLTISIVTAIVILAVLEIVVLERYKQCVIQLSTIIDELENDHDGGKKEE